MIITQSIQSYILQGDGVSTSATINLGYAPTSISFVQAFQAAFSGGDVSSNVLSVTLLGSVATVNFVAPFSYPVTILLNESPSPLPLQMPNLSFGAVPALTAGQTVSAQSDSTGSQYVNTEGRKATYRASVNAFTPITSGSFPVVTLTGSATKTIRITRVRYQVTGTTGIASYTFVVLQRFSAISGGSPIVVAAALVDTNNPAATAVCNRYSTLPTVATANGGIIDCYSASITTASAANPVSPVQEFDFGNPGQELVLRGTSDFLGIRTQNVAAAPSDNFMIEWTEE